MRRFGCLHLKIDFLAHVRRKNIFSTLTEKANRKGTKVDRLANLITFPRAQIKFGDRGAYFPSV